MKQVVLEIPDDKWSFFSELIINLGFVKLRENDITVPEYHKQIVRERIKSAKDEDFVEWDAVKKKYIP